MRKRPHPKRKSRRIAVRSTLPLKNGHVEIPAGTRFTVENNHGGLTLAGEACPHCGLRAVIKRVPETAVEIIEEAC